ncbi:hypothetical protein [uncultured Mitsuokella sp.]|uniref:hypothetical protein n=1 Tax=uncultured Mitsuokella sp. TaxID=453120 RepID=UPI00266F9AB9|nr:hypothetical protein [uncultured Mitsuokella sp.]
MDTCRYGWLETQGHRAREKTVPEMGRALVKEIESIANGRLTKAEAFGFSDIAVDHVCRYV